MNIAIIGSRGYPVVYGRVLATGQSANNTSNDPAAPVAVQAQ